MADYLIPYVEFLGLPGSGKSYYSHKVADLLRKEGYKIAEPSWELDHTTGKYTRAIKKLMMAWLFSLCHRREAADIKEVVNGCGLSDSEAKRILRNVLYKAYLLNKRKENVLFFDEGIAQMSVSMSVNSSMGADQIYKDIMNTIPLGKGCLLIRIDCSVETALLNMDMRTTHDSHVERLLDLDAKKMYLTRFKSECASVDNNNLVTIPFCFDSDKVVAEITNIIKTKIW